MGIAILTKRVEEAPGIRIRSTIVVAVILQIRDLALLRQGSPNPRRPTRITAASPEDPLSIISFPFFSPVTFAPLPVLHGIHPDSF